MAEQEPNDNDLVLVTGGSGGIGRAVVETLAESGRRVAFTYRSGAERAAELSEQFELVTAHQLDLAERQEPKRLVEELESDYRVVGLVNNAGLQTSSLLAMTSDEDWDRTLDINLSGAFRCCRAVLPMMVRRRGGSIVNVASLGAVRGVAGQAAYAASKAGLLAMTRVLAREMGRRGIRVNAVIPGFVETPMTASLSDRAVTALRAAECLPKGVDATAVAAAVRFLLSEEAGSVTGESLHVDAGASA